MFNGEAREKSQIVLRRLSLWRVMQKSFPKRSWTVLGPGCGGKWYGTCAYKPDRKWNQVGEEMLINFRQSGHHVFRGSSALNRGALRSKGGDKLLIHYCGDLEVVELVFSTVVSVSQLSIYLRSSCGLVQKTYWTNSELFFGQYGETCCGR